MVVSNDPGLCSAVVDFPAPVVSGIDTSLVAVTVEPPSGSTFPVGTNEVDAVVSEGGTNLASCSFNIIVKDTEPPSITTVGANKSILWPPNHKLANVIMNYQLKDNCDPAPSATLTVTSSEDVNAPGSGHTGPDWQVLDAHHVMLRAERSGKGSGRTYTITISSTDSSGNSSSTNVTVVVPHDKGKHKGAGNGNGNTNGNNGKP
jgi:hypothetical protein